MELYHMEPINNFDNLISILNPSRFQSCAINSLKEENGASTQEHFFCKTDYEKIKEGNIKIFKFDYEDTKEQKLFPFFNLDCSSATKRCDYLIFIQQDIDIFIICLEMKTGDKAEAKKNAIAQLEATETFVTYLINTAERIYGDKFDKNKVNVRKVILYKGSVKKYKKPIKESGASTQRKGYIIYDKNDIYVKDFLK